MWTDQGCWLSCPQQKTALLGWSSEEYLRQNVGSGFFSVRG